MRRRTGISFSPLMLPYVALAIALDQGRVIAGMLCAVIFHEAAHALAARLLSLEVTSLRITPFGGIAEIEDLSGAAHAEALVALAGPAASLALAMTLVFVHRYLPFSEAALRDMVQWNLLMCAFNLLPGLPLDGGRVLRALLTRRMGLRRATLLTAGMGVGIGIALLGLAVAGAIYGIINATLVAAALVMLLSGIGEMRGASLLTASEMARKHLAAGYGRVLTVRHYAAHGSTPVSAVSRRMTGREYGMVTVLDDALMPVARLSEADLARGAGLTLTQLAREARKST